MRVSEFQNVSDFLFYHSQTQSEERTILEHLASGKKINKPSDNPLDYHQSSNLKAEVAENADFTKNIENMMSEFSIIESSLNGILEGLERATELTVQGANETYGANGRETIANEIEEILNGIISTLNTRHEGHYLFAGTNTSTEPFSAAGNYLGNSDTTSVRISQNDTMVSNIPGDDLAFGPGGAGSANDIIDLLQETVTELRADNTSGITTNLTRYKGTIERINGVIASLGSKSTRLVNSLNFYQDFELNLKETISEMEDTDLAEEISLLNQNKVTQEAQLRSQSTIGQRTLLDYLG
ncbi:MAG: flagellar hook-associated protein 3 [Acidobacteria bacterium]|nr:MAG: flagellar hook-associated protein 3 [Acidobacteriota bacterium]